MWKHASGYYLGGVIVFCESDSLKYTLKIDHEGNLYRQGKGVGKVVEYSKERLIVRSEENEMGKYVYFGEQWEGACVP